MGLVVNDVIWEVGGAFGIVVVGSIVVSLYCMRIGFVAVIIDFGVCVLVCDLVGKVVIVV